MESINQPPPSIGEPQVSNALVRVDVTNVSKCSTTTIPEATWELHKPTIVELYKGHNLKTVRHEMSKRFKFLATEQQYKSRFAKWEVRKNKSTDEMLDLIDRGQFKGVIRDKQVSTRDLRRFYQRHEKRSQILRNRSSGIRKRIPPRALQAIEDGEPRGLIGLHSTPSPSANEHPLYLASSTSVDDEESDGPSPVPHEFYSLDSFLREFASLRTGQSIAWQFGGDVFLLTILQVMLNENRFDATELMEEFTRTEHDSELIDLSLKMSVECNKEPYIPFPPGIDIRHLVIASYYLEILDRTYSESVLEAFERTPASLAAVRHRLLLYTLCIAHTVISRRVFPQEGKEDLMFEAIEDDPNFGDWFSRLSDGVKRSFHKFKPHDLFSSSGDALRQWSSKIMDLEPPLRSELRRVHISALQSALHAYNARPSKDQPTPKLLLQPRSARSRVSEMQFSNLDQSFSTRNGSTMHAIESDTNEYLSGGWHQRRSISQSNVDNTKPGWQQYQTTDNHFPGAPSSYNILPYEYHQENCGPHNYSSGGHGLYEYQVGIYNPGTNWLNGYSGYNSGGQNQQSIQPS